MKYLALIFFSFTIFLPGVVDAQSNALVPCNGGSIPCTECHLVEMGNTVIVWLIGIMFIIFGFVAVAAGWGLVTAGGNPGALSDAKGKFTNAFIGLIVVLAAWLIVDTFMRQLLNNGDLTQYNGSGYSGFGLWSEIDCGSVTRTYNNPTDFRLSGTDAGLVGPTQASGPAGAVTTSPGGNSCFPGLNGVFDGGRTDSDDICISTSNVSGSDYALPDGSYLGYSAPPGYFGPEVIAANPQITPNFRLCDVTNCDAARRRGDYVYIDPFMVQQLENVRSDLGGLSVNSGYRSPGYNSGVGGATHSRHQYGDAVDIAVTSSNTEARIKASCDARGATNIYTYESGRHVHCDWRGAAR